MEKQIEFPTEWVIVDSNDDEQRKPQLQTAQPVEEKRPETVKVYGASSASS